MLPWESATAMSSVELRQPGLDVGDEVRAAHDEPDLRPVAVGQHDPPPVRYEPAELRGEPASGVELLGDRGGSAAVEEGVAPDGDDGGAGGGRHARNLRRSRPRVMGCSCQEDGDRVGRRCYGRARHAARGRRARQHDRIGDHRARGARARLHARRDASSPAADGADRRIRGVNVMEDADIVRWMRGGELLLTTGYTIRDDPSAPRAPRPGARRARSRRARREARALRRGGARRRRRARPTRLALPADRPAARRRCSTTSSPRSSGRSSTARPSSSSARARSTRG